MKKFKKFSSFLSICLTISVVLVNFSFPVLAYEKNGVNFEQVRTITTPDNIETTFNKINPSSKEVKSISLDSSINKKEKQNYVEDEILVKYKNNKINLDTTSGRAAALNFSSSKSLEKKEDLRKANISVLKIKDSKTVEEKIAELKNDPNIEYVEPNYRRYPTAIDSNDTYKNLLWGLDNTGQSVNGVSGTSDADIDAPEAWTINEGTNASIIVAVIDSGVAYNHPDLIANMWNGSSCKDEYGVAIVGGCNHGYDYADGDNTPLPTTSSHGTHIAGTIAAEKNNNLGIIGVAPQAKIMAIKFGYDIASELKAIDFSIQNGAKVINASFGGADFSQSEYDAINRFKTAGGIFVAAAGNSSADNDGGVHSYPSDYDLDNIISVAAMDQNDNLALWSSYGAISVDVGAPGTNIYSTVADSDLLFETFEGITPPNIPSGWVKTDYWGTYDTGVTGWDNVLYGDVSHMPYIQTANSVITSPTYNLSNVSGAKIDFWTKCDTEYDTENWTDYMSLEISNDGANFTELGKWDEAMLDYYNGDPIDDSGGAVYHFQDIIITSQYFTSAFQFRLRWVANGNTDTGGGDGCLVDDIKIIKYSDGSDEQYDYGYMQGTSMATPHVVGLAGLIWGYKPDLTYSEVKNTILTTGNDLSSLAGKTVSGKRINAFNALDSITPPIISNVQTATTTATSTAVIWSTDVPATSKVVYSTSTPVSSMIVSNDTLVTNHSLELTGLTASTTYYFYTESSNKYGNIATSTELSFTTLLVPDITPPIITLNGSSTVDILVGDAYSDAGAKALDDIDGDITSSIVIGGDIVDSNTPGAYIITYNVSDSAGNPAIEVTRTVNVVVPISSAKAITAFSFAEGLGAIDEDAKTIAVIVPYGTDVTNLVPTIVITGTSVNPASGVAQDFTNPITYIVTAEDSSTQDYIVTVIVADNPDIAAVAADKSALVDDSIKGENIDLLNITTTLTNPLPSLGANGSIITWVSDTPSIVSDDGQTINRPDFASGDLTVTLTATITKGLITDTKVFTLTVLKLPASTVATITSVTYAVSSGGTATETITNVPFGTAKTTFLAALVKGETHQTWVDTGISDPVITGNTLVITAQDGITTVVYTVTVNPVPDTTAPVITLLGANPVNLYVGDTYIDDGATASDNIDGDITSNIVVVNPVNTSTVDTYIITYNVSDLAGNPAEEVTRTVNVLEVPPDTTAPIIAAHDDLIIETTSPDGTVVNYDSPLATDDVDGAFTAICEPPSDSIFPLGETTVTCTATDIAGNPAIPTSFIVTVVDTTAPVITLLGENPINLYIGDAYSDAGATALDNIDGDITANIITVGLPINTTTPGAYTITYNVSDAAGNPAQEATRTVNVIDVSTPIITLLGENPVTIEVGSEYIDAGATASDDADGDITDNIVIVNSVDSSVVGAYTVTYNVTDSSGNPSPEVIRTVNVVDTTVPVITLIGNNPVNVEIGYEYNDAGATASDNYDGDITSSIITVSNVDYHTIGSYTVTYNVTDSSNNSAEEVIRTVIVGSDLTPPVITLTGGNMSIYEGTTYVDLGAIANDNIDGDITDNIIVNNLVDSNMPGIYTIAYNVSDVAGNPATEVIRTVTVLPVGQGQIVIEGDMTISTSTPEILIGDNAPSSASINVPATVTNAQLNVSALLSGDTTKSATIPSSLTVNSNTSAGEVNIQIPQGTQISGNSSWTGEINLPQVQENSSVSVTPDSGNTADVSSAIEIGFGDTLLNFNKAVRIKIAGQAGKYIGYSRNGVFTQITDVCSADSQVAGDALAEGAECKINIGSDLIIWTKHFTKFATYTQTAIPTPASSGGGGGGGGGGSYTSPPSSIKGDINKDNKVDKYDFALIMANWGKTGSNDSDLNGDNKVDKYDFALLMLNWSK